MKTQTTETKAPKIIISIMKSLAAVCGVCFLLLGIVKLCNYLVVDDADSYTRLTMHELYEMEGQVETVFLGSSHCFRAFNPMLYEELTGEVAYNLGSSSQNYDTSYYLLKEAVRLHPIKRVYLDMYYSFFFIGKEDRDLVQANIISDYMKPSLNKLDFILQMSSSEHYTNSLFPFRREWRKLGDLTFLQENVTKKQQETYRNYGPVIHEDEQYVGRGFAASQATLEPEKITWWDKFTDIDLSGDDSFPRESLDRIVRLCREEGIELIFVTAPSFDQYWEEVGPYDPAHAYIQEMADGYGILYMDFNLCKDAYLDMKAEDFMDVDHLNGAGAEKLTGMLAKLSKELPKDAANQTSFIDEYFLSCYDVLE